MLHVVGLDYGNSYFSGARASGVQPSGVFPRIPTVPVSQALRLRRLLCAAQHELEGVLRKGV